MKTKFCMLVAAVLVHFSFGEAQVGAQYPGLGGGGAGGQGGYGQPTLNPYLNLNRPGNTAINYFGMVRPQQDFRNGIQGLNTAVGAVQSQLVLQEGQELALGTGHAANFMTQGKYFMTRGSRGGGAGQNGMRPGAASSAVGGQQGQGARPPTTPTPATGAPR